MNYELYRSLIVEREKIADLEKRLKTELANMPKGTLKAVLTKGKYIQYYINDKDGLTYIKKDNIDMAKNLAQKEYDYKLLSSMSRYINNIDALINSYKLNDFNEIYRKISDCKKKLIRPYFLPEEEFVQRWIEKQICEKQNSKNSYPISNQIVSEKGEAVRSKSEKIIADKLYREGIPYIYEPTLHINSYTYYIPDFLILNKRTRKEYYYEHFGMMSDTEYCEKAIQKLNDYSREGYIFGENLLYSFESLGVKFDDRYLEELIKSYLV